MTDQPPTLTPARLAEIEARTRAATPGPWFFDSYSSVFSKPRVDADEEPAWVLQSPVVAGDTATPQGAKDCNFASQARQDIPALLSHLRALEAESARLRELLFNLYNMAAMLKFEPEHGQPHPLKDGVYDKLMAETSAALQPAKEPE